MDSNHGKVLKITDSEKDLGVTFTSDLKFDTHITNIVNKGNQLTGLIKRSFSYIDAKMFNKLYKAIVRPHLEYANIIWHPIYKRQLRSIENIQKRASKLVPGLTNSHIL